MRRTEPWVSAIEVSIALVVTTALLVATAAAVDRSEPSGTGATAKSQPAKSATNAATNQPASKLLAISPRPAELTAISDLLHPAALPDAVTLLKSEEMVAYAMNGSEAIGLLPTDGDQLMPFAVKAKEKIIKSTRDRLRVSRQKDRKGQEVIAISFTDYDPNTAKDFPTTLAAMYLWPFNLRQLDLLKAKQQALVDKLNSISALRRDKEAKSGRAKAKNHMNSSEPDEALEKVRQEEQELKQAVEQATLRLDAKKKSIRTDVKGSISIGQIRPPYSPNAPAGRTQYACTVLMTPPSAELVAVLSEVKS